MTSMPPDRVRALADAVGKWRMQENIALSSYTLYVAIIFPQRWNRGKTVYLLIRYGLLVSIALRLGRDYRNYFSISQENCKAWFILSAAIFRIASLATHCLLGLCLAALLQAKTLGLMAILTLSCGLPFTAAVIDIVAFIQYPSEPTSALDAELGYGCYYPSEEKKARETIAYNGLSIRAYLNLAGSTFLFLLGVATVVVRYKGKSGRLFQVLLRDGGIHYLCVLAIRLVAAIVYTPAIFSVAILEYQPAMTFLNEMGNVITPILAQRLLINMRKVDYMGSQPVASKLLFANPPPGSEDDLEKDINTYEMAQKSSDTHFSEAAGVSPENGGGASEGSKST